MTGKQYTVRAALLFPDRFVDVSVQRPSVIVHNADYYVKSFHSLYNSRMSLEDAALVVDRMEILSQVGSR